LRLAVHSDMPGRHSCNSDVVDHTTNALALAMPVGRLGMLVCLPLITFSYFFFMDCVVIIICVMEGFNDWVNRFSITAH